MSEAEDVEPDLLGALAEEVSRDPGPFVSGYLVLPDDRHFPDRFTPTRAGVTTLLRRLHDYLGIADVEPQVELEHGDRVELVGATEAELVHVDGEAARYRVGNVDAADVVFALLHQAARAAILRRRAASSVGPFRDLETDEGPRRPSDDPREEMDATLHAIARGLGVLVAAGAHQYRAAGEIVGPMTRTMWRHTRHGALEPWAASFLLAAQLAVRTDVDREKVLAALPRERADEVKRASGELTRDVVIDALGLPPPGRWPAPARYPVPTFRAAEAIADAPALTPRQRRKQRARGRSAPVFRVRRTAAPIGFAVGLALGLFGVQALSARVPALRPPEARPRFVDVERDGASLEYRYGGLVWLAAAAGCILGCGFAGARVGRRRFVDRCSDPDCEVEIPPDRTKCPGCRRVVAGVVGSKTQAVERTWDVEDPPAPD